jgi:glycosyltransferase involved in cell wall biosynthesis
LDTKFSNEQGKFEVNSNARVALLTNFLPIYRVPLLECLAENVSELRVFLSVKMEGNRNWPVFWGQLNVVVNRSITIPRTFRNSQGYVDQTYTHIPTDTLPLLWGYRPDVIVSSELGVRTIMARIYKILRPSTKLIIWATLSERTEESRGALRKILRHWLLNGADAVYVNGASGSRYIRSLGYDGLISVVPYAADNSVFLDPGTRQRCDTLRLLYTGQLVERKGLYPFLQHLVHWCKLHPGRSVTLSVVGSGDQLDLMKRINVPPNLHVDFKGNVKFEQLPSQYHSADLYVYPTLADEWGLVVNEAMIAGLPVLGSRFSQAVEELIQDGVNGWLFIPSDEQDTYDALERALGSNPETLDAMSRRAIETVAGITQRAVAERMGETIFQVCRG